MSDAATIDVDEANLGKGQRIAKTDGGLYCIKEPTLLGEVRPLPAIENGHITFGVNCDIRTFSPSSIAFWSDVLNAVDDARLLVGNTPDIPRLTRERVIELFSSTGVSDRIDFLEATFSDAQDSTFFNRIDIYLDSTNINGTLPLCYALWLGVPVVSPKGQKRSSALGASILTSAGKPEWIGSSIANAAQIACGLASDQEALATIRTSLRDQIKKSKLMNTVGYTGNLLAALKLALDAETASS